MGYGTFTFKQAVYFNDEHNENLVKRSHFILSALIKGILTLEKKMKESRQDKSIN